MINNEIYSNENHFVSKLFNDSDLKTIKLNNYPLANNDSELPFKNKGDLEIIENKIYYHRSIFHNGFFKNKLISYDLDLNLINQSNYYTHGGSHSYYYHKMIDLVNIDNKPNIITLSNEEYFKDYEFNVHEGTSIYNAPFYNDSYVVQRTDYIKIGFNKNSLLHNGLYSLGEFSDLSEEGALQFGPNNNITCWASGYYQPNHPSYNYLGYSSYNQSRRFQK